MTTHAERNREAATVPRPGLDGPCRAPCTHGPCRALRATAAAPCAACGRPIGYGRAYVTVPAQEGGPGRFLALTHGGDAAWVAVQHYRCTPAGDALAATEAGA